MPSLTSTLKSFLSKPGAESSSLNSLSFSMTLAEGTSMALSGDQNFSSQAKGSAPKKSCIILGQKPPFFLASVLMVFWFLK
jgi:hypothetical protein